jgi:uncharacterized protein (DUF4415 family)
MYVQVYVHMKAEYDFSRGKRGAVVKPKPGTTRITIRLDSEVLDWFLAQVDKSGGKYQSLINDALRSHMEGQSPDLEKMLRRVIRAELKGIA